MTPACSEPLPPRVEPEAVLDLLAQSETPLATDGDGHVVFWNRAADACSAAPRTRCSAGAATT